MKNNILIVEDEALIALSLKERVEELGYHVSDIVDRGENVMDRIKIQPPNLILMDISLKGEMDGIETAHEIKKEHNIPVIYLTSYSNKETVDRAMDTNPYGYMIKSIDDVNLGLRLDVVMRKHKNHEKEKQLAQKKIDQLTTLYENNSGLVIRIDLLGNVSYINKASYLYFGIDPSFIMGENLYSREETKYFILLFEKMLVKVCQRKRKVTIEDEIVTPMGKRFVELVIIPEKNKEKDIETLLFVVSDITDQKIAINDMRSKQRKIEESIGYSKKIQSVIFPKENSLEKHFPTSFLINSPKDGIGGDFLWVGNKDDSTYIGAIDCTGHGVPGALMSLVTHFLLNKVFNNELNKSPGKILDVLHLNILKELKQHYHLSDSKDGADMSLCKINSERTVLEYAGAHRPMLLLREGELTEVKGDRYPIGGTQYRKRNRFKTHKVDLDEGDIIIMFSDGLPDQFGGKENGKIKYGMKRIRELLLRKCDWDIKELGLTIEREFKDWKGTEKQIDDVLVIGLQV